MAAPLLVAALVGFAVASPWVARAVRIMWERPVWAVVLTIALVAAPLRSGPATQSATHITPADLGGVVLVLFATARVALGGDHDRLGAWAVLPVVALAVSVLVSGALAPSGPSLSGLVRYEEIFCVLPLATYVSIREPADLVLLVRAVLVLAVGEGAVGIVQFVTRRGAGISGQTVRAVGTFGSYDVIAMSKVVAFGLMAALALRVAPGSASRRAVTGAAALLLVALAMSLSRGSWLAAAIGVVIVLVATDRRRLFRYAVVGLAAVTIVVVVQGRGSVVVKRFDSLVTTATSPDQSVRDRYALWSAAVGMWEDHPLTGVGPKEFPNYRDAYVPVSFSGQSFDVSRGHYQVVQLLTPHSLYLLLFAELGTLGGLAYGWLLGALLVCAWLRCRRGPDEGTYEGGGDERRTEHTFTAFALGVLVVLAITSATGDIGGPTTILDALLLGCGLWAAAPAPRPLRGRHVRGVAVARA
jgi:hypothetical protein